MSDKDLIVQFLEKAEKRVRTNRRFNEIARTLAISLVIPVTFKVLDLIFLFRGRTVTLFLGIWAAATAAWMFYRLRGSSPLAQVADNVDHEASLNDELRTAYWFIQNPRDSAWVDLQVRRTAQATRGVRLDSLYPRQFPRISLVAVGLAVLLVGLNFIPLSLNHNWMYLQAAPPFRLNDVERTSINNALRLLQQAKAAENEQIAQQIEEIIQELEQGEISVSDAVKRLDELKEALEAGDLDASNMTNGLQEMAAILRQSEALEEVAQPLAQGNLGGAAEQIQDLAQRLDSMPAGDLREMAEKFQDASERPRSGLEDLASAFDETAGALERKDVPSSKRGLERVARELNSIMEQLADQQLRSEAGDEIGDLMEALEGREQQEGVANSGQQGQRGQGQNQPGENSQGQDGETGEIGEGQQGEGDQQGQASEAGEPGGEAQDAGQSDTAGGTNENAPNGRGGNSFGGSTQSAPLEGEATTLEVQLMQEALKIEGTGGEEKDEENESAGEQERSKLDYRNAPSNLTPAQKDLLSQDRIPWESKQLIKNYFEAVKPAEKQ